MSARLLALSCLLSIGVSSGWTDSEGPAVPDLVVYLKTDSGASSSAIEHMKQQLSPLMRSAGFHVEWRDPQTPNRVVDAAALVVLELHGACGISSGSLTVEQGVETSSLASTAVAEGRVLPFSWINCSNLTRILSPALASQAPARRDFLYGRAMARLTAHELYHILMQTRDHGRDGVAKAGFTAAELLTEHFAFEQTVLAKFHRNLVDRDIDANTDAGEGVSGRQP